MAARNINAKLWYVASLAAGDLANEAAVDAKSWALVPGTQNLSEAKPTWSTADTTSRDSEVETALPTTRQHAFNASIFFEPGNATHLALIAACDARTAVGLLMADKTYTVAGAVVVAGSFYLKKAALQWSDVKGAQMLEIEAVPAAFAASEVAPVFSFIAS